MTPSKWILAIGAIIEAMLLGLFIDVSINNRHQEMTIQQTPEVPQSKAFAQNQQPTPEALEGASFGLPIILNGNQGQIISREGYTLSYNESRRIPNWVSYELTRSEVAGQVPREKGFYQDPEVNGTQANLQDYKYSGWDRGHMAPAGDMKWSETAMYESCYLSNICPQNPDLNGGRWRILEEKCRDLADDYSSVNIVCGPIIEDGRYGTIGDSKVVVPDAFFKVLLIKQGDRYESIGFYFKNEPAPQALRSYSCSVDEIENKAGIDFFSNLSDEIEDSLESRFSSTFWGI